MSSNMCSNNVIESYKGWYYEIPPCFYGITFKDVMNVMAPKIFSTFKKPLIVLKYDKLPEYDPSKSELLTALKLMVKKPDSLLRIEFEDGNVVVIDFTLNTDLCKVITMTYTPEGISYFNCFTFDFNLELISMVAPGVFHGADETMVYNKIKTYHESFEYKKSLSCIYHAICGYENGDGKRDFPKHNDVEINLFSDIIKNFADSPNSALWRQ